MNQNKTQGFTLIEVLLALAIIAIALTALLKATSNDIAFTQRIKEKTISHWVAVQGVNMIQLGLLTIPSGKEITEKTLMFNQNWYWRAKLMATPFQKVQEIHITVSTHAGGPFTNELVAYRFNP